MRLFEGLILLSNLFLLVRDLLTSKMQSQARLTWVAFPVVFTALHVVLEGYRWQMIPAYLVTVLVSIWTVWRMFFSDNEYRYRTLLATFTTTGVLLLASSTGLALMFPVFQFPVPTGPYLVGTVSYHWTDVARTEIHTVTPLDQRELVVQVWYPGNRAVEIAPTTYLSDSLEALRPETHPTWPIYTFPFYLIQSPIQFLGVKGLPLVLNHLNLVSTHSYPAIPVSAAHPRFPVLIFSHGYGVGMHTLNTFQVEELASHGFVVVGINHTFGSHVTVFPDGRIVEHRAFDLSRELEVWVEDARFVLNQLEKLNLGDAQNMFTGRLDPARVGIFGHSLGGVTAEEVCRVDHRFRAGLNMDGTGQFTDIHRSGLKQPFMFMKPKPASPTEETSSIMRERYESLENAGYYLAIEGFTHFNFTDLPLISPMLENRGITGPIDGLRGMRIVNDYTLAFFQKHLNGRNTPLLEGPSIDYPEVFFEIRNPGR